MQLKRAYVSYTTVLVELASVAQKHKIPVVMDKIQLSIPLFCPEFSPHNASSMGKSEVRSDASLRQIVKVNSSNDATRRQL